MAWTLGVVGATPSAASLEAATWDGESAWIELDLAQVGFDPRAHAPLFDALEPLLKSEQVQATGAVDIAHLRAALVHEPWNYLRITGACPTLDDWRARRQAAPVDLWAPTQSWLTGGSRLIEVPADAPVDQLGFTARSGGGHHDQGTFVAEPEVDTLDFLPNGMPRFAVYDARGALAPASPESSATGGPETCQWCHEGALHRGNPEDPGAEGYLPPDAWSERLDALEVRVDAARSTPSAIPWGDPTAHTHGEMLAREYLLPTVDRVAREWGVEPSEVDAVAHDEGWALAHDGEFPDRGQVLVREEVDRIAAERLGYAPLPLRPDFRELHAESGDLANARGAHDVGCW